MDCFDKALTLAKALAGGTLLTDWKANLRLAFELGTCILDQFDDMPQPVGADGDLTALTNADIVDRLESMKMQPEAVGATPVQAGLFGPLAKLVLSRVMNILLEKLIGSN